MSRSVPRASLTYDSRGRHFSAVSQPNTGDGRLSLLRGDAVHKLHDQTGPVLFGERSAALFRLQFPIDERRDDVVITPVVVLARTRGVACGFGQ